MANIQPLLSWCQKAGCPCRAEEAMAGYTTFRIGGPAQLLILPQNKEQLAEVIKIAGQHKIPVHFIGNGSNLLAADQGVEGAVICLANPHFGEEPVLLEHNRVFCTAGVKLASLCRFALKHSLTGLEFAYGIPGAVGGAVYMNAGAYGGEIKDVILWAEHLDHNGKAGTFSKEELALSYRRSIYMEKNFCITGAVFALSLGEKEEIRRRMDDYMDRRRTKQPLEYPSAGSTFKRPDGAFASALIDQCGLKGRRVGGACVSTKHAGFIVNDQNATCKDVLHLIAQVQEEVLAKTGFSLECEVKLLK